MSDGSGIEWTDATWNPVTGCTKISPGCTHCYAERMAARLKAMGMEKYAQGFEVRCHPDTLQQPDHWRKPRLVFVCSMGDLFHDRVPETFIDDVFATIKRNPQHRFQILTKRADRLRAYAEDHRLPDNAWLGVTVESNEFMGRLEALRHVNAAVRFVSFEPLLGPVAFVAVRGVDRPAPLDWLDWVIVGGETGPGARPVPAGYPQWIRDVCLEWGVPFFFKQWGSVQPTRGPVLGGRTWRELPEEREAESG
jgi:protein gp37